jgi:hypothetical protein
MTRARDVANVLSAATSLATDTETAAAITAAIAALPPGYGRGNTASRPASPTVGDIYVNTQTGFVEIYESTGWSSVGAAPSAVTGVTTTNSPSGRAYNNGRASVAFTPGTFAGSSYTVISSPGSYTASGASSPILITGLQSSTQYTYTVTASGKYGISLASSPSTAVTATTVPQAPTIDSVTGNNAQVSVAFTAGATGGSAITEFTVTSSPGSITASGSSSPLVVTGLTNGTAYTFTMTATNTNGTSVASSASSLITPAIPSVTVSALVIAGGGSATSRHGGGGGAGGYIAHPSLSLLGGTSFAVTVGAGAPQNSGDSNNANGVNSTFIGGAITLTALGGGSGGNSGNFSGTSGGSGGGIGTTYGGSSPLGLQPSQSGDSGTYGFGNNGGNGNGDAGGGGGGSGGGGGNAPSSTSTGSGGAGKSWLNGTTYAGGGCGAGRANHSNGSGGSGGGGGLGTAGSVNTGSGGGGGNDSNAVGGAGGSGIVILRASGSVTAASTTGSPIRTESGGYTYYQFNNSGSITY